MQSDRDSAKQARQQSMSLRCFSDEHEDCAQNGIAMAFDSSMQVVNCACPCHSPVRCTCGYRASSEQDFDEHVLALMHDTESHFQAR